MNKNQEAFDLAKEIIDDSPYELWTPEQYAEAWDKQDPNHTKEMIFELINNGSDDWADREGIGYLLNEQGYADAICTKLFVDMLQTDPADVRNEVVIPAMYDKDLKKTYGENQFSSISSRWEHWEICALPTCRFYVCPKFT